MFANENPHTEVFSDTSFSAFRRSREKGPSLQVNSEDQALIAATLESAEIKDTIHAPVDIAPATITLADYKPGTFIRLRPAAVSTSPQLYFILGEEIPSGSDKIPPSRIVFQLIPRGEIVDREFNNPEHWKIEKRMINSQNFYRENTATALRESNLQYTVPGVSYYESATQDEISNKEWSGELEEDERPEDRIEEICEEIKVILGDFNELLPHGSLDPQFIALFTNEKTQQWVNHKTDLASALAYYEYLYIEYLKLVAPTVEIIVRDGKATHREKIKHAYLKLKNAVLRIKNELSSGNQEVQ